MKNLAAIANVVETSRSANDFAALGRLLLTSRGDPVQAQRMGEASGAPDRVLSVLKAHSVAGILTRTAVTPATTTGSGSGAELALLGTMVSGFIGSLRNVGLYDRLYGDMQILPLRVRIGAVSVGITGSIPGQAGVAALSKLTLTGNTLEAAKAQAIISLTDELARFAGPEGAALFSRELRQAVALSTDSEFLRLIFSGISPTGTSGTTESALRTDLNALFAAMGIGAQSRLYIATTPAIALGWSFKVGDSGSNFLAQMSPQGGEIQGIPVVVSDSVPSGYVYALDANAIAAGSGSVELDVSKQADLIYDSQPDSPSSASTVVESLWQHNKIGLRATRWFGSQLLRSNGVAAINNVSY